MGLLVDGIIGPILETFGVVTVDENGEWKKPEKPEGDYQKKEKPERESLGTRVKEWSTKTLTPIKDRIKELTRNKAKEEEEYSGNGFIKEAIKNEDRPAPWEDGYKPENDLLRRAGDVVGPGEISKKLRRISKMEAKTLLSTKNYSLWCHTWVPFESEIKRGVVYQVMHNDGAYGAMYDDYYVYDELGEKEKPTELGYAKPEFGKITYVNPMAYEPLREEKRQDYDDEEYDLDLEGDEWENISDRLQKLRSGLDTVKKNLDETRKIQENITKKTKEMLSGYNVCREEQPYVNTPRYSIEPVNIKIDENTGEITMKKMDRELYECLPKKDPDKFYTLVDPWDD